jgi:hypothetical protein
MRRTYISPEFNNNKIYGTYNMVEESNFFCGKMLEIEDYISIENQDIIYYQKNTGEQLNVVIESSLQPYFYSSSNVKKENHTLVIDETQNSFQKDNNTRWILEVNLRDIFYDYIFSTLKKYRTFEGLRSEMTSENDVNVSIRKYIDNNVLSRYRFKKIDLLVEYQDIREQNILRYRNNWKNSLTTNNIVSKTQTETSFDESTIKVIFSQDRSSKEFTMNYFFNLLYEKI